MQFSRYFSYLKPNMLEVMAGFCLKVKLGAESCAKKRKKNLINAVDTSPKKSGFFFFQNCSTPRQHYSFLVFDFLESENFAFPVKI